MNYQESSVSLYAGDCLDLMRGMEAGIVNTCVTSPPYYGLRDYGMPGQLGLEKTPAEYVARMVEIFREVRRLLRDDGTLWLNLGDSYCNTNGFARADPEWQRQGRNDAPANNRKLDALHEAGYKTKDLIGIPWMVAFALRADGWYLRQDIIWAKPNPMPESVTDRCTKSHEYIFMLSKSARYFYDAEAIKEPAIYRERDDVAGGNKGIETHHSPGGRYKPLYKDARSYDGKHTDKQRGHGRRHAGFNDRWDAMSKTEQCGAMRNKRSVWTVAPQPFADAHFATFPPKLIQPCILAGCPEGGTVLDPFMGAGTTAFVAKESGRKAIGCELNPAYIDLAIKRLRQEVLL